MSAGNTSREHSITTGPTGLIAISGGKLTSNRVMGKQLVDAALTAMGRSPGHASPASVTPISGGGDPAPAVAAARHAGVPAELATLWKRRYGSNAGALVELWERNPNQRQILGARLLTHAEITYCVTEEMALSLTDLTARRTPTFFWDAGGGLNTIDAVADEMGSLLGWDDDRRCDEVDGYRRLVAAHRPTRTS